MRARLGLESSGSSLCLASSRTQLTRRSLFISAGTTLASFALLSRFLFSLLFAVCPWLLPSLYISVPDQGLLPRCLCLAHKLRLLTGALDVSINVSFCVLTSCSAEGRPALSDAVARESTAVLEYRPMATSERGVGREKRK